MRSRRFRESRIWFGARGYCLWGAMLWMTMAVAGPPAFAATAGCNEGDGTPEPRVILALFDGVREASPRDTRIHRFLEFPLNHLGYALRYWDISGGSPPQDLPEDVAGTVSWFDGPVAPETGFFDWAAQTRRLCGGTVRLIAFGDPGLPIGGVATPEQDAYLNRLGVSISGDDRIVGVLGSISLLDKGMIGKETDFILQAGRTRAWQHRPDAQAFLRIRSGQAADGPETDLVTVGPQGGFVQQSATVTFDPRLQRGLWILDPFTFFEAILGTRQGPIPDVTTLVGRRLFFSTVNSEGWLSPLPALQFDDEPKLGAEMLLVHLIRPNADLPITVAVLTGDLDPATGGRAAPRGRAVAEAVFDLPHVQAGTTGASYIRTWDYFASYDPALEGQMINRLRNGSASEDRAGGLVTAAMRGLAGAFVGTGNSAPGRVADAPRDYANTAFSVSSEVPLALRVVQEIGLAERPPPVFLWSGDARPFDAALDAAQAAGAGAIGGGGGVYNQFSPALSGLSPLSVPVGDHLQVYAALTGDEAYTNYWTDPGHGFYAMAETLAWTETPRRLKPYHLAFSAQSTLDLGTREAVKAMLQRARETEVVPVTAATYIAMVEGFQAYRAERIGPLAWRIQDRGALATLRFDRASELALDLEASLGTLGARRKGDVLYVALNPATPAPEVHLVRSADPTGMHRTTGVVGLLESRLEILDLIEDGCRTQLWLQGGFGAGTMTLYGPPSTPFGVDVSIGGAPNPAPTAVTSGPDGRMVIELPAAAGQAISLSLSNGC